MKTIDLNQLQALEKVINYLWEDEKKHFQEMEGSTEGHIFESLKVLHHFFNGSDNEAKKFKVLIAWGKEQAEQASKGTPPIEQFDVREFNTKEEAIAYDLGIAEGNGWENPFSKFEFPQTA